MARSKRRWIVGIALLALGGFIYVEGRRYFAERSRTSRLVNQVWIERMPRDGRDRVGFFHLQERGERPAGVLGRSSRWRVRAEVFLWGLSDDQLRMRFPQDGTRVVATVATWRCRGKAPSNFDWCLTVSTPRGKRSFYTREKWRTKPRRGELQAAAAQKELGFLRAALRIPEQVDANESVGTWQEATGRPYPFDQIQEAP